MLNHLSHDWLPFALESNDSSGRSVIFSWCNAALSQDDQIKALAELFMRRQIFLKAERQFKKPKPGKKRLAKWPKKLISVPDLVRP